jgi:nucleoid DNA-binding protein
MVKKAVKKATPKRSTSAISKPFTKTEIVGAVADHVNLAKKEVVQVLESLLSLMTRHLKKGAAEVFVLPGILKMQVVHKPARKAREGINPFTGERTTFKAKPASRTIKIKALKKLKDEI